MSLRLAPRTFPRTRRPARRDGHTRTAPLAAPLDEVARHQRAGGPEDTALYACSCGLSFRADVSASVACPGCGVPQAW